MRRLKSTNRTTRKPLTGVAMSGAPDWLPVAAQILVWCRWHLAGPRLSPRPQRRDSKSLKTTTKRRYADGNRLLDCSQQARTNRAAQGQSVNFLQCTASKNCTSKQAFRGLSRSFRHYRTNKSKAGCQLFLHLAQKKSSSPKDGPLNIVSERLYFLAQYLQRF